MESASSGRKMRGSAKGEEPVELLEWKEVQISNDIEPEYRNLPRSKRDATENRLFIEQTGQCVYCGRRISLIQKGKYHIEHFRPQSKYRALQLDYTNLFLSCGPESDQGVQGTCGNYKNDWFEEDCHIVPFPPSCAERFRYRLSGKIAGDGSPEADKMIRVLNLEHRELVTERKNLLEHLERQLMDGEVVDQIRQDYEDTERNGARPSFANVAIGYLKTQVNAGF